MFHVQNITTLFVSQKSGSDDNQGFFPENNCMMTGPVRTIEHALAIIAELRVFGALQPIQIKIMDETYLLDKTLRINNSVNSVTIEPYTKTLLCGGTKIDWFAEDCFNGSKCLSADLSALGEINFSDFYINNRRAAVTRYPQAGVLRPEDVEDHSTELGAGSRWFVAKEEDFEKIKSFKNVENCIVSFNHYWVDEHSPIKSIDPTTRKVTLRYKSRYTIEPTHPRSAMEYIIENASEMFLNPGEWYFDKANKKVYYIPLKGEKAESIVAYIPCVSTLVRIEGEPGCRVNNVTLRGFDMAYTRGDRLDVVQEEILYAADVQSESRLTAAIEMKYAYRCVIENCRMSCIGLHAIALRDGAKNVQLRDTIIYEIGAGGIVVSGGAYGSEIQEHTSGNVIMDNRITACGRRYYAGCGILMMHTYENIVAHNEISNLYYSGISCGWVWGYGNNISHDNLIEKNHIFNLGNGVLSDIGGIYLLGKQPGTVVRGNLIHDVTCRHYGGWALYTDEGSSGILLENNVCYNTNSNSFQQHYGSANTVRNNIFAFSKEAPVCMAKPEAHLGAIFEQNLIISHGQYCLHIGYPGKETGASQMMFFHNNLFFDTKRDKPQVIQIGKKSYSFSEYKEELGIDVGGIYADPEFEDIENFVFHIRENSPAFQIGFQQIDLSDVGPRN